jgi:hypothetical protein
MKKPKSNKKKPERNKFTKPDGYPKLDGFGCQNLPTGSGSGVKFNQKTWKNSKPERKIKKTQKKPEKIWKKQIYKTRCAPETQRVQMLNFTHGFRFECQIQLNYIFSRVGFSVDLTRTWPITIPTPKKRRRPLEPTIPAPPLNSDTSAPHPSQPLPQAQSLPSWHDGGYLWSPASMAVTLGSHTNVSCPPWLRNRVPLYYELDGGHGGCDGSRSGDASLPQRAPSLWARRSMETVIAEDESAGIGDIVARSFVVVMAQWWEPHWSQAHWCSPLRFHLKTTPLWFDLFCLYLIMSLQCLCTALLIVQHTLLEKRFIRTPGGQYCCRLLKWADTINFFCSGPLNQPIPIIVVYLWYRLLKWAAPKYFFIIILFCNLY